MSATRAFTCDNEADRRGAGNTATVLTHLSDLSGRGLGVSLPSNEEWRPVLGYEGLYEVSTEGRVRTLRKGHLMHPHTDRHGYLLAGLSRDGKQRTTRVHHMVLEAFVGPRPEGLVGCHNNGDPSDNRLENLRWDTQRNNNLDAVRHGRNNEARKENCSNGHPLSGDNLRVHTRRSGKTTRRCVTCQRALSRAWKRAWTQRRQAAALAQPAPAAALPDVSAIACSCDSDLVPPHPAHLPWPAPAAPTEEGRQ